MRCADFGPMPGRRPSSSMRERRGPVYIVERGVPSFVVRACVAVTRDPPWATAVDRILGAGPRASGLLAPPALRSSRAPRWLRGTPRGAGPAPRTPGRPRGWGPLSANSAGSTVSASGSSRPAGPPLGADRGRGPAPSGADALSSTSSTSFTGVPKCAVSFCSTVGTISTQRSRCAALGSAKCAPCSSTETKRPALKSALARAGRPLRMPSPHASVSASRSTGRRRRPARPACRRLAGGGGLGWAAGVDAAGSAGVLRRCGRGAPECSAACLLRRTAPRDGRRPTSAGRRGRRGRLFGLCGGAQRASGAAAARMPVPVPAAGGRPRHPVSERSRTLTRSDERLDARVEVGPHGAHERRSPRPPARPVRRACRSTRGRGSRCCAPHAPGSSPRPERRSAAATAPEAAHSSGASAARNTWRRSSMSSVASCCGPHPPAMSALSATRTGPTSPSARASSSPSSSGRAASADPDATTWSRAESASRAEPRPRRTAASTAPSSRLRPAWALTDSSRSCRVSAPSRRNSRCWVRLRMVGGTFWGSVVASTNTTWLGGSSSVLSSALAAAVESMCTSSTM